MRADLRSPAGGEAVKCPICSSNNPHEARFCVSCGIPLGPQGELSPRAERRIEFAPLDLSGLLQETFTVYRRNFWRFVLISFVPQVPSLIFSLVPGLGSWIGGALFFLGFLVLYPLASGASVCAVAQQYLETRVDARYCYRKAWFKIVTLVLANVANTLALIGAAFLIVIVVGIPLLFYLVVVWFFFVECIMLEREQPLAALWRSRDLVRGNYWRLFRIGVVFVVLMVALLLISGGLMQIVSKISLTMAIIAYTAAIVVVLPVISIGRTLVYFDLRVRKEKYTMDELAGEMGE